MKTYGTMRDYIYSKTYQNIGSEMFSNAVIASKINTAKYYVLTKISHPLLSGEFTATLGTNGGNPVLGTEFTFPQLFKKIHKVIGLLDDTTDISSGIELARTYRLTDNNKDEYKAYDGTIVTTKEYNKLVVFGEIYLRDIEDNDNDWNDVFELGELVASIIEEYVVSYLSPFQLQEGYNQAQYHKTSADDMLKCAALMYEFGGGQNTVKNSVY